MIGNRRAPLAAPRRICVLSCGDRIELDHELDGRWIAEVPELNALLYGDSKQDAIERAQSAAREIVLDRITKASCLPIRPKQCSTMPHECSACGESAPRIRRLPADRMASRPHCRLSQNHEKGWRDSPFSFHDTDELGPALLAKISKKMPLIRIPLCVSVG
jgi:predicted RNase H-like HicB family nuclease